MQNGSGRSIGSSYVGHQTRPSYCGRGTGAEEPVETDIPWGIIERNGEELSAALDDR